MRLPGVLLLLLLLAAVPALPAAPSAGGEAARSLPATRHVERFGRPEVRLSTAGAHLRLEGCDADVEPGAPALPVRSLTLAVPDGFRPARVTITPRETAVIDLAAPVACAPEPVPISSAPRDRRPTPRDQAIYGRRAPYPDIAAGEGRRQRLDRLHGDDLLTLCLHPVQFLPAAGRLLCHGELLVEVEWAPAPAEPPGRWRPRRRRATSGQAAEAAPAGGIGAETFAAPAPLPTGSAAPLPPGVFDHVVIAPAVFIDAAPPPWNLEALAAARREAGLASTNVAVEWIDACYAGRDLPERIRSFIRDAYDNWGTRFVLLAGSHALVPARKLHCSFSAYSAMIPADSLYYGCLDGDFDGNGNGVFGEIGDGIGGGDVDVLAEVQVGRFPVAGTNEICRMVRKTLAYEAAAASALAPVSHVGEYLGFGGLADYATGAMEQIRLGATDAGFTSLGFENPVYGHCFDTTDRLYDTAEYRWPAAEMLARLGQNRHVFNHLGHGAAQYCFKINLGASFVANRQAIASLTNSLCSLVYSQACDAGSFDTHGDCFAAQLLSSAGGAFAAVMNARSGWGYVDSVDGPSQRFHRKFWDGVFAGGLYHLGTVNMRAKESLRYLLSAYAGNAFRWCYYEITFFGDPATPFAARLLPHAPTFEHDGLQNRTDTIDSYVVTAGLGPAGLLDPATPRLLWEASSAPGVVHTNPMTRGARNRFTAAIPAQPQGTAIRYRLLAETLAGVAGTWPAQGTHRFDITPELSLAIGGEPAAHGEVTPPYGRHVMASGVVVRAQAPWRVLAGEDVSHALEGFAGTGSVTSAPLNQTTFTLSRDSTLTWRWALEYALRQTSNIPGLLDSFTWHRAGGTATSDVAPPTVSHGGTEHAFAGWYLDEQRQPPAPGRAENPLRGIVIDAPRLARALYLPATRDLDGNGIPDWWEFLHFGAAGQNPAADEDGDGFTLREEYEDRTDPLDPSFFPGPPLIRHTPPASPHDMPPPFLVEAGISDSHMVASATLHWRRNEGEWRAEPMPAGDADRFAAVIPAPGAPGDTFTYLIVAADPAGHAATNGPHVIFLRYPLAELAPSNGVSVLISSREVDTTLLTLTNRGNAPLSWQLGRGLCETADAQPGGWNTNAFGQPWRIVTNRCHSPPRAFHAAPRSAGGYTTPAVHAGLLSPPFRPAPGARLEFHYWIASELDTKVPGGAYDGGIVEVSTNGGTAFQQLPGPYTHRITGWAYSPWPDGTPCLAGDGAAGWQKACFDLSTFAGRTVHLRFTMGGDNNTDREGWYLDDIRLGPVTDPPWPAWALCGATGGNLAAGFGISFPLFSVGANAWPRDDLLPLYLLANDPVSPLRFIDWRLKVRDPPWLAGLAAAQTSTNGEGMVTLELEAGEIDGEPLALEVAFSRDGGNRWEKPLLTAAAAGFGGCELNVASARVERVATAVGEMPAVNRLAIEWNARADLPALPPLHTGMLMRVRAFSPWFASGFSNTPPFLIDNEAPPAPEGLASTTHTPGVWSSRPSIAACWTPVSDGAGIGGVIYSCRLADDPLDMLAGAPESTSPAAIVPAPEGPELWLAVQARDAFGNRSAISRLGGFRVDLTPPTITDAVLTIARSEFGNYAVGPDLAVSWRGFRDALSGIEAYLVLRLAAGHDTPPLQRIFLPSANVPAVPDVANTIIVYPVDAAGNTGPGIGETVLVLAPDGDHDGDGQTTADEEIAGTDALDVADVFRLGIATGLAGDNGAPAVGLVWKSLPGRRYTVWRRTGPPSAPWQPFPPLTDLPGTGAVVTNTIIPDASPAFFRLGVRRE